MISLAKIKVQKYGKSGTMIPLSKDIAEPLGITEGTVLQPFRDDDGQLIFIVLDEDQTNDKS